MRPQRSAVGFGTLALALASASLAGCPMVAMIGGFQSSSVYTGGRLTSRAHSHRLGCVEIATALYDKSSHTTRIAFDFGNRCDFAAPLALDAVRVYLHDPGEPGADRVLSADDPNHEIRAASLEARTVGREVIAYDPLTALDALGTTNAYDTLDALSAPKLHPTRQLCVDVARVARGGPVAPDCFWLSAAPLPAPPSSSSGAHARTPIPPGPTLFDDPTLDRVLEQLARGAR